MRKWLLTVVAMVLILTACNGAAPEQDEAPVVPTAAGAEVGGNETASILPAAPAEATERPVEAASPTVTGTRLAEPTATATPQATATPTLMPTPRPTAVPAAEVTTPTVTSSEVAVASPVMPTPVVAVAQPVPAARNPIAGTLELTRIEDTDPAPPIAIEVSAIRTLQNGNIRLTGTVRNDGAEAYGGISVIATFYDREPKCYMSVDRRGNSVYVCDPTYHGPVEVYAACSFLQPGASCPFSLEVYPRDYGSYHLHPEGTPLTYRQPASITVSNLRVTNDGFGYLHITGTASNPNSFPVSNARVAGALYDADSKIISVGSVPLLGQIPAGASAPFELRIEYEPYATYQLYPEAVQG